MERTVSLIMCLLVFLNCTHNNEVEQWSRVNSELILDSLKETNAGCYLEPAGFFILEFTGSQKLMRKLTYRKGFPVYIDTLSYVSSKHFHSKKEDIIYLIKDTSLTTIHYVKIFHPNSNMQGQTPWTQPYVTNYRRLNPYKGSI